MHISIPRAILESEFVGFAVLSAVLLVLCTYFYIRGNQYHQLGKHTDDDSGIQMEAKGGGGAGNSI
jgi:hypothetical protein